MAASISLQLNRLRSIGVSRANAGGGEAREQSDRSLDREAQSPGQGSGREQRHRCEQIDSGDPCESRHRPTTAGRAANHARCSANKS